MPRHNDDKEQAALLGASYELEQERNEKDAAAQASEACRNRRTSSSSLTIALTIVLVVVFIDIFSLIYASYVYRSVFANDDMTRLPIGNPYIGLAELYMSGKVNATRLPGHHIFNKPRIVAPVFPHRPTQVTPEEELVAHGSYGTLSPHEKHFQVDYQTDTIVQFRTVDFGLEHCSLMLLLPHTGARVEGSHPYKLSTGSSMIRICPLEADNALDTRSLSWRSRPTCIEEREVDIAVRFGEEMEVMKFYCPWASYHTFEVSCADTSQECEIDVWTSQNQTWGMYLYQHQSI